MNKFLVTIEFRYNDVQNDEVSYPSTTITIGVFDTIELAIEEGNKSLEVFEKHFPLNIHWNRKERFSKNGSCFGGLKDLVTDLAYLQTPFSFYAKITKLNYLDVNDTILSVLGAVKRYRNFKLTEEEED